ncbi:uracil-DNA glycosylase [Candidatus Cytomitobacter indipagum]|uniref:Type-4 uracil-DNA glycosylase n=1 Tax=Candidatus Cytomitobacter indipagum TaxID=2601575 RepID=A0A5C0UFT0_9PROT|nr:uracil-DNA glycosylase [Candidatus Cytomitobacter indipagum]QEK37904.1 uracil-DNA glycosylase [Candidatus Cytomitobacter indipagum]
MSKSYELWVKKMHAKPSMPNYSNYSDRPEYSSCDNSMRSENFQENCSGESDDCIQSDCLETNDIKIKKTTINDMKIKENVIQKSIQTKEKKMKTKEKIVMENFQEFVKSNTLSELRSNLAKIEFPFKKYATTMVFSDGNSESPLMLIGEAPGQEEDKQGKPFVGESGKLLESMLNAAKIYRKNYYITNIVPWRPPENRAPTTEEIKIMRPYILNHIEIINPKIVILIGSTSYKAVMNQVKAITTVRGEFIDHNNRLYIPIFHPSYLLRSPSKKKDMWRDMLSIKNKIKELNLDILE